MIHPDERKSLLDRLGFTEEDFTYTINNEDTYHCYLGIDIASEFSFQVDSTDPKKKPHIVTHDFIDVNTCTCEDFFYRGSFCKHRKRATLVLMQWKKRQPKDADEAPLNGNKRFTILR